MSAITTNQANSNSRPHEIDHSSDLYYRYAVNRLVAVFGPAGARTSTDSPAGPGTDCGFKKFNHFDINYSDDRGSAQTVTENSASYVR